jgi:hypothetical protein
MCKMVVARTIAGGKRVQEIPIPTHFLLGVGM